MNTKKKKGEKGYLAYKKKVVLLRTLLLFALSLAVFLTGYFSTGSKENLLTIVAVLGCLPACRSAVNAIMLYRYHGISDADYRKISTETGSCAALSDLVFTSYEKNFEIHHMAFAGNTLIGYTANAKCDAKACEKHLHGLFVQNSLSDVDITIFKDLSKYKNRLQQIQNQATADAKDAAAKAETVCALLRAVSL